MPITTDREPDARLRVLATDEVVARTHGEVTTPETLNYRTFVPERGGLYCEQIFGEIAREPPDARRREAYVPEPTDREHPRRTRAGLLRLAAPVVHVWTYHARPSLLASVLGLDDAMVESIVEGESHLLEGPAVAAGEAPAGPVTSGELSDLYDRFDATALVARTGAAALRPMLERVDLAQRVATLRAQGSEGARRAALVEAMRAVGVAPVQLLIEAVAVLPPALRPMDPLGEGRVATSGLTDLYRRVVNRNNRLRRLIELDAPSVIVRDEAIALQLALDSLWDNAWAPHSPDDDEPAGETGTTTGAPSTRWRSVTGPTRERLEALTDRLAARDAWRDALEGLRADPFGTAVPAADADERALLLALGFAIEGVGSSR